MAKQLQSWYCEEKVLCTSQLKSLMRSKELRQSGLVPHSIKPLITVKSNLSSTLQGRLGALVVGITFALNL